MSLKPINDETSARCVELRVTEPQQALIAPNSESLQWAGRNPRCVPLGISRDETLVGFAMFEPRGNDVYSLHRFMIDRNWQRQGIGREAMRLIMDEIRARGGRTIYLSFRPENVAARAFYERLGFRFHEEESDGELIYVSGPAVAVE